MQHHHLSLFLWACVSCDWSVQLPIYVYNIIYIYNKCLPTRSIVRIDNFCSFRKSMLKSLLFALLLTKIHTCKKYQSKSKQSFLLRIGSQPNGSLPNNGSDQKVKLGVYLSSKTWFWWQSIVSHRYTVTESKIQKMNIYNRKCQNSVSAELYISFLRNKTFNIILNIPLRSHFLGIRSPCAHLLNKRSSKSSCLSTTWLKKDLNFAEIILPFPHCVDVALQ